MGKGNVLLIRFEGTREKREIQYSLAARKESCKTIWKVDTYTYFLKQYVFSTSKFNLASSHRVFLLAS